SSELAKSIRLLWRRHRSSRHLPYTTLFRSVGGFTESLAQEVAPFGVKVCALEPGGMRTNWGVRANAPICPHSPWFEGTHLDAKRDRKSTRLNSSHVAISYAVFCLKKKKNSR